MRVQLQRDEDPNEYDSRRLVPAEGAEWVTVEQATEALRSLLSSPKLPHSQAAAARAAFEKAAAWLSNRPPNGWSERMGQSFLFDRTDPEGFRLDVENLFGWNLRS